MTNRKVDAVNVVDYIIDYEADNLNATGIVKLFQYLLDSGLAWTLQGSYGRTTMDLLNGGYLIKR